MELNEGVVVDEAVEPFGSEDQARDDASLVHLLPPVRDHSGFDKSTMPSENIPVWTPRSCLSRSFLSTASGGQPSGAQTFVRELTFVKLPHSQLRCRGGQPSMSLPGRSSRLAGMTAGLQRLEELTLPWRRLAAVLTAAGFALVLDQIKVPIMSQCPTPPPWPLHGLRVHRPAAVKRHPAPNNPVDEPDAHEGDGQPRDQDADPKRHQDKENAERDPQQSEPERPDLPSKVRLQPRASPRFT